MVKYRNIFRNKIILVTGHTGFKGAWLSLWLTLLGAKVIGYSLKPIDKKCDFYKTNLSNKIYKSYIGDLKNYKKILNICDKHKPEIIFHLAAQAIVSEGLKNPYFNFSNNIQSTLNLLEIFRKKNYFKVGVFITSDKVYKNIGYKKKYYSENDIIYGEDPYSSSKAITEMLIDSYLKNYITSIKGKILCSARAGNVLGGGDYSKNRIFPDIIRSLNNNQTLDIRNPNHIRPWQYILECLDGYLTLACYALQNKKAVNGAWNFGPSDKNIHNVKKLVNETLKYFKYSKVRLRKSNLNEKKFLSLDTSKAMKKLRWRPKLSFKETVRLCVDDYSVEKLNSKETFEFRCNRIKEYMKI